MWDDGLGMMEDVKNVGCVEMWMRHGLWFVFRISYITPPHLYVSWSRIPEPEPSIRLIHHRVLT
jgi:hypothetical protein